ncbi:MAG: hypothetical protein JNK12_16540 [Acidimicrobiales bacterium]|nr:hypothetical protein [Acidimicrobiales bacterium]
MVSTLVIGACAPGPRYGEDDLRPEADLTFPGAIETDRSFLEDESGRSIHGDDLSSPAVLDRSFDLDLPTSSSDVYEWYEAELTRRGWSNPRGAQAPGTLDDDVTYRYRDDGRTDTYSIRAGPSGRTVTGFLTRYTIDVELDDG